jgi:hypothetical protein
VNGTEVLHTPGAPDRSEQTGRSEMLERVTDKRALTVAVLTASAFLLLTMGGAIVVAPLSIPLLYAIAHRRTGGTRWVAVVLAVLTVAEVGWAATYVTVGEGQPWIWLVPVVAAVGTLGAFLGEHRAASSQQRA